MDIDVTEPAPADNAPCAVDCSVSDWAGRGVSLLPFLVRSGQRDDTAEPAGRPTADRPTPQPPRPRRRTAEATDRRRRRAARLRPIGRARCPRPVRRRLGRATASTTTQRAVFATIRESHEAYAASLSGLLGARRPQEINPIFDDSSRRSAATSTSVLDAAYDLEATAVATHLDISASWRAPTARRWSHRSSSSRPARHGARRPERGDRASTTCSSTTKPTRSRRRKGEAVSRHDTSDDSPRLRSLDAHRSTRTFGAARLPADRRARPSRSARRCRGACGEDIERRPSVGRVGVGAFRRPSSCRTPWSPTSCCCARRRRSSTRSINVYSQVLGNSDLARSRSSTTSPSGSWTTTPSHAEMFEKLTTEAGGTPWTCGNPKFDDVVVNPILTRITQGADATRDGGGDRAQRRPAPRRAQLRARPGDARRRHVPGVRRRCSPSPSLRADAMKVGAEWPATPRCSR